MLLNFAREGTKSDAGGRNRFRMFAPSVNRSFFAGGASVIVGAPSRHSDRYTDEWNYY